MPPPYGGSILHFLFGPQPKAAGNIILLPSQLSENINTFSMDWEKFYKIFSFSYSGMTLAVFYGTNGF
jgi:hypothetical protein